MVAHNSTIVYSQNIATLVDIIEKQTNPQDVPVASILEVKINNQTYRSVSTNSVYLDGSISSHAEINAINEMSKKLGIINYHGIEATLYSTLEPCLMCAGAISLAKIPNVIFGIRDEKFGFINNMVALSGNYKFNYLYGFCEDRIKNAMKQFFYDKR
jgi:tRNA(adenine34) deaminase